MAVKCGVRSQVPKLPCNNQLSVGCQRHCAILSTRCLQATCQTSSNNQTARVYCACPARAIHTRATLCREQRCCADAYDPAACNAPYMQLRVRHAFYCRYICHLLVLMCLVMLVVYNFKPVSKPQCSAQLLNVHPRSKPVNMPTLATPQLCSSCSTHPHTSTVM